MDNDVLTGGRLPGGGPGSDARLRLSTAHRAPATLDVDSLVGLVDGAPDGVALVDVRHEMYVYVNPAGCRLLEQPLTELVGTRPLFPVTTDVRPPDDALRHTRLEFEHSTIELSAGPPSLRVVYFREVSRQRQHERLLGAFSRTSASIAFAGPLASVLDRLAEEVRVATGMAACTFLLMDENGHLRQAGMAAEAYPGVPDYGERIERCRALGAPLLSLDAFHDRKPVVALGWREQTLADPRFQPIHDISADASWSTLATVPLIGRGEILGVMNGYYLEGGEPHDEELSFLTAIADQAAVAVENARLLGAVESKAALEERHLLARELHDSVNQALFSLTLQTRALEIGMINGSMAPGLVLRGLADIRELTEGALAEMRALIFQLRPAALREEGLVLAVRKLAAAVAAKEGTDVRVEGPTDKLPIDQLAEEQLFRVVQEAVHNVVKHAGATSIVISIDANSYRPDTLNLTIRDDGGGFDSTAQHPGHLGLQTMAERIAQIGGTFTLHSHAHGTTVQAAVPGVLQSTAVQP